MAHHNERSPLRPRALRQQHVLRQLQGRAELVPEPQRRALPLRAVRRAAGEERAQADTARTRRHSIAASSFGCFARHTAQTLQLALQQQAGHPARREQPREAVHLRGSGLLRHRWARTTRYPASLRAEARPRSP